LEKLGFGEKIKTIKSSNCIVFRSIGCPHPAVTLYIYRVGWTYPVRNSFTDLNLLKTLITVRLLLDRSDPPVRPVDPLLGRLQHQTGQTAWSDRLMSILAVNISLLFFGEVCLPNNILLSQKYLRAM
jgi:hypothetical protein